MASDRNKKNGVQNASPSAEPTASNPLKWFFLFSSGAQLDVLMQDDCKNEHNKYIGIGSAVFFTALFAFSSSFYAIYMVFRDGEYERTTGATDWSAIFPAVFFGFVWGCFIYSLDRYIVSTLKKEDSRFKELLKASPRIALAALLAAVISKPLELRVFEKEIENELIAMQQAVIQNQEQKVRDRYEPTIRDLTNRIKDLQGQVDGKYSLFTQAQTAAQQEADGTGGSGIRNLGPIYRIKKEAEDLARREYEDAKIFQPEIDRLRAELDEVTNKQSKELDNLKRVDYDGLLARITALGNLTEYQTEEYPSPAAVNTAPRDSTSLAADSTAGQVPLPPQKAERPMYKSNAMYYANWAILLLFLTIEMAPLLFKIFTEAGPYDIKIQTMEEEVRSREIARISRLNSEINRDIKIVAGENQNIAEKEVNDNKALLQMLSDGQAALAKEIVDYWKDDQLKKIRQNPEKYFVNLKKEEEAQ
jgi:hypothetical protein